MCNPSQPVQCPVTGELPQTSDTDYQLHTTPFVFSRSQTDKSHFYLFLNKFYKFTKTTSSYSENGVPESSFIPRSVQLKSEQFYIPISRHILHDRVEIFSVLKTCGLSVEAVEAWRQAASSLEAAWRTLYSLLTSCFLSCSSSPGLSSDKEAWQVWSLLSPGHSLAQLVRAVRAKPWQSFIVTSGPRLRRPKVNVKASISPINSDMATNAGEDRHHEVSSHPMENLLK